jgi:hypothetical protein
MHHASPGEHSVARAWALEACGRIWSVGGLGRLAGPPRCPGPGRQRPVAGSGRPSAWGLAPTADCLNSTPGLLRPASGLLALLGGRCRGTGGHRPDLTGTRPRTAGRWRPAAGYPAHGPGCHQAAVTCPGPCWPGPSQPTPVTVKSGVQNVYGRLAAGRGCLHRVSGPVNKILE